MDKDQLEKQKDGNSGNDAYHVRISPAVLQGTVPARTSKSAAHRGLICAAMADRPTEVEIRDVSEDIERTAGCIEALGGAVRRDGPCWTVFPVLSRTESSLEDPVVLDCGESGTTLRLLIPVAAGLLGEQLKSVRFLGRGRLPERPLQPLPDLLRSHGFRLSGSLLPLTVSAGETGEAEREWSVPGNISSQYVSGLLLALAHCRKGSRIRLTTALESKSYVYMTLAMLHRFQIRVLEERDGFSLPGEQQYRSPGRLRIEGDWSNAAFWMAAGAAGGGAAGITVTGLDPRSPQGDAAILDLLKKMGAEIEFPGRSALETADVRAITVRPPASGRLDAFDVDASEIPDLVPVLATLAATAAGTSRLHNAARLRLKESDRLAAMADCLTRIGADVTETPDALMIRGRERLKGGTTKGYNDHRIVMATAVAAAACEGPLQILGADAVRKSYPMFFEDLSMLGGQVDVDIAG